MAVQHERYRIHIMYFISLSRKPDPRIVSGGLGRLGCTMHVDASYWFSFLMDGSNKKGFAARSFVTSARESPEVFACLGKFREKSPENNSFASATIVSSASSSFPGFGVAGAEGLFATERFSVLTKTPLTALTSGQ